MTMVVTYVTTPGGSQSEAKVSRLLRRTDGRPLSKSVEFAKNDSPTAGLSQKRKRSIFVSPQHGKTSLLGSLEIPAVGLDVPFREGVFDAVVAQGPGHWPGTPLPGAAGNSVFAGHRTTYTKPFADLDLLQKGDAIRVTVGKGERLTYRVFQVTVIP
ncbi:MAG: sortase [Actinomycetota bacterium]